MASSKIKAYPQKGNNMPDVNRRKFLGAAAGSAVMAAIQPSALLAAQNNFSLLPSPSTGESGSLMAALKNRRSTRSFSSRPPAATGAVGLALGSFWCQPPGHWIPHGTLTHEYPGNRNIRVYG
jgi:hypothetical protein